MAAKILVAGAAGNLGKRIVRALRARGAEVVALARNGVTEEKIGVTCVVSALQGLPDAIVDTQSVLLDSAIAARVPRFIPSDFSRDFTKLPARFTALQAIHNLSSGVCTIFAGRIQGRDRDTFLVNIEADMLRAIHVGRSSQ